MFKKPFHDKLEDHEILERYYQDGNVEWLGILLPRFSMLLYGLCFKYLRNEEEARDAVQQVFIKAMSELPKYRVTYIKSWLYTVAKNHCLMKLRNTAGRTIELNESTTASAFDNSDEEIKEKELKIEALEKALQGLNTEQRTCITLFYLQKKSYTQVSDETGYTMMQVKSHIQNGKRNLKILLSARNNEQ